MRPLREYQQEAVDAITRVFDHTGYERSYYPDVKYPCPGFLLFDDMGLGKTATALAVMRNRMKNPNMREIPSLVVCPPNCMDTWIQEILDMFGPGGPIKVRVYRGTPSKKRAALENLDANCVVVVSYNTLAQEYKTFIAHVSPADVAKNAHRIVSRLSNCNRPLYTASCSKTVNVSKFMLAFNRFRGIQGHPMATRGLRLDNLPASAAEFFCRRWNSVVMDEAHCVKNGKTLTAKAAGMLLSRYRLALTGTPVMNAPKELENIMRFACGYGKARYLADPKSFIYRTCTLGRLKSEVLREDTGQHLTRVYDVIVSTDGFPSDRQLYIDFLNRTRGAGDTLSAMRAVVGENAQQFARRKMVVRTSFFSMLNGLRMITLHRDVPLFNKEKFDGETIPAFGVSWTYRTHMGFPKWFRRRVECFILCMRSQPLTQRLYKDVHRLICTHLARQEGTLVQPSPKLLALGDIYALMRRERPNDKMIVFSSSRVFLERVATPYFEQRDIKTVLLCGDTQKNKSAAIARFKEDPEHRMLLANKSVAGVGLNFQDVCGTLVLMEPGWNDAIDRQAMARVDRVGQTRTVHTYRLMWPNSVDTGIRELQKAKRHTGNMVLYARETPSVAAMLRTMIEFDPKKALRGEKPTYAQGFLDGGPFPILDLGYKRGREWAKLKDAEREKKKPRIRVVVKPIAQELPVTRDESMDFEIPGDSCWNCNDWVPRGYALCPKCSV